jgi:hypothetical protein
MKRQGFLKNNIVTQLVVASVEKTFMILCIDH